MYFKIPCSCSENDGDSVIRFYLDSFGVFFSNFANNTPKERPMSESLGIIKSAPIPVQYLQASIYSYVQAYACIQFLYSPSAGQWGISSTRGTSGP